MSNAGVAHSLHLGLVNSVRILSGFCPEAHAWEYQDGFLPAPTHTDAGQRACESQGRKRNSADKDQLGLDPMLHVDGGDHVSSVLKYY